MGQAPRSDGVPIKWKSLLSLDGTPIEYSWKWNTRTSEPDVRYVTEPIGQFPGTELDPLNQQALREILHHFAAAMPSVDLSWVNHFLATLYDHDNAKYAQEAAAGAHLGTSIHIAAEFLPKGVALKTYFFPRKLGQNGLMPLAQWEASICQLNPDSAARTALHEFIASSPEGKLLTPFSVGVDNVVPAKSRLKWYFHTSHTSFASVRDIMTLGGRITTPHMAAGLADLHDLIKAVVGLPRDFSEDAELPAAPQWDSSRMAKFGDMSKLLSGYLYYFDIAPANALPEIKIFIPVRYYARDDLSLARGITGWMKARGRDAYCERYLRMLESLSEHRRLDDGNGLQTFVSCLFKKNGELDITTYLGAEAFHPGRLTQGRATRRRGD
jgi:DMATS type aromatic prenyltransferase